MRNTCHFQFFSDIWGQDRTNMKKRLLGKIVLVLALVLLLNALAYHLFYKKNTTYSWGYDRIHAKRTHLEQNPEKYNTLVMGSSAFYRHINPEVFDAANDGKTQTFNFGINALFPPQGYYIYEELLKTPDLDLKYAFLDLFEIGNAFLVINAHKNRNAYWYTGKDYRFAMKAVTENDTPPHIKASGWYSFTLGYIVKLFNAGIVENLLLFNKNNAEGNIDFSTLGRSQNGYYALDEELEDNTETPNPYRVRLDGFLADTNAVVKMRDINADFFKDYTPDKYPNFNETHLQKLNDLIAMSKAKGVHLIFVVSPRMLPYQYKVLMSLYEQLPPANRINLSKAEEFPEFYFAENTFDFLHLNQKGSTLFSQALADKFNELELR